MLSSKPFPVLRYLPDSVCWQDIYAFRSMSTCPPFEFMFGVLVMFRSCRSTVLSCAVAAVMLSGCNVETASQFATVDESGNVNAHPVLAMRGAANMTLVQGATFVEPGVTALDFEDGDLSAQVISDADGLNTNEIGLHKITYRVTDSGNASATPIVRTVMVVPADANPDEQLAS